MNILCLTLLLAFPLCSHVRAMVYDFPAVRPPFTEQSSDLENVDAPAYLAIPYESFTSEYKLDYFEELTVEAWVFIRQWDHNAAIVSRPFSIIHSDVAYHVAASPFSTFKLSRAGSSQKVRFTVTQEITYANNKSSQSQLSVDSASDIELEKWVHIAGTFSKKLKLISIYVNGQPTGVQEVKLPGVIVGAPLIPLFIGRSTVATPGESFSGFIDEVRIWNRCKSVIHVKNEYQQLLYGDEPDLIFYINLESGPMIEVTGNVHLYRHDIQFNGATIIKSANAPVSRDMDFVLKKERSEL